MERKFRDGKTATKKRLIGGEREVARFKGRFCDTLSEDCSGGG